VQVYFASTASSVEYIRVGKLRALAVTTATRSEALPNIPAMGEFIPGYEVSAFYGFGVPNNTPAEIIDKLNMEVIAALADIKLKARLADLGILPLSMFPSEFRGLVANETEKWGKVVQFAGLKPE
jgi:tripartite-type tricarboxylate transporter receptor subunit TctC